MKKKIVLSMFVALGAVLLVTGCGHKAKLKDGKEVAISVNKKDITVEDIYDELKSKYAKQILADIIDKKIFNDLYKGDEEIEKQVNNYVEYIKSSYSDNWEETLKNAGYDSEDAFKDEIRLNYQRQKAVDEYLKKSVTDDEIQKYYDDEYSGNIEASHILIKVAADGEEGLSDEDAKKKAEDLIKQLDDGADFATLAKENSEDTGSATNGGALGSFNKGQMVKEFEEAAYALKENEYTKEPVKTTYGYHIILKTKDEDKKELKDAKEDIIEKIIAEKKEDSNYSANALEAIRKENGLKFEDTILEDKYNEYLDSLKNSN
ncbi:MAG: peptidylprolyl isomerase [Bacilli bacterium]|nr:peptidylprolyl isomerase [Bacilli bacterium]